MADAKISALTNLTAADPTNDMIPIVDVSETPPATGNTKRISINNILSSSPTASGALTVTGLVTAGSATITGAATVGTTLGVTGVSTLAGNLLVGTTNNFPTSRLCVQGTAGTSTPDVTIGVPLNASSNTNLAIGRSATTGGYIYLDAYKAAVGGTELVLNHLNNGTVLIGTSTVVAAGGCLQLRSGITFPITAIASANAKTLDDYEEGIWTPTSTSGTNLTAISHIFASYTKVGRVVTLSGYFSATVTTGSTLTYFTFGGLPFAVTYSQAGVLYEDATLKVGFSQTSTTNLSGFFAAGTALASGSKQFTYSITYYV